MTLWQTRCAPLAVVALAGAGILAFGAHVSGGTKAPPRPDSVREPAPPSAVHAERPPPYPRGRWRLASWGDLDGTVLWLSHIVVAHRAGKPAGVPQLRPVGWAPDAPAPDRSADEAFALASSIAREAQAHPERFAALAAEHSDDVVTRAAGGSLGGERATQLPAAYLDALAVLSPGQVSQVIETAWGYHVLLRRPPPADAEVAGRHIVVRYKGAFGGEPIERTRNDALVLARRVAEEARATPDRFADLVAQYSNGYDRVQGGDFGRWSIQEPADDPRALEALVAVDVGGVAGPIETPIGFEILQRTAADPRPRFAMNEVVVPFDPAQPDGEESSKAHALARARAILQKVQGNPSLFGTFQRESCCFGPRAWTRGRGEVDVESTIERLGVHEIAPEPIVGSTNVYVVQRLDADSMPLRGAPRFELPAPRAPTFDAVVAHAQPGELAKHVRKLAKDFDGAEMPLDAASKASVDERLEKLAAFFEKTPYGTARVERLHATLAGVRDSLGPERYEAFEDFLRSWSLAGPRRGS
jgi:peptidyl-prolyl cis-trans isomerase NIMA-interacting 1